MKKAIAVMAVLASGCAVSVPTTGVVQRGGDVLTVTHQAATGYHSTEPLKNSVIAEATAYCKGINKKYEYLHSKEIAGKLGQYTEAELTFRCN